MALVYMPDKPPVPAPETMYWSETEEEREINVELLFGRPEEGEDDWPEVQAYTLGQSARRTFRCDEVLANYIDAIGHAHKLTRSEAIRRLCLLGVHRLEGRPEMIAEQLELAEPVQERRVPQAPPGGEPKALRSVPHAKQEEAA
jgi:hypothetical protein